MSNTEIPVAANDSLWGIAQNCGLPGGGSGWQAMNVKRGDTIYDLSEDTLPGGLQPGDIAIIPEDVPHSCAAETDEIGAELAGEGAAPASQEGAAAQAAANGEAAADPDAAAVCSTTVIFVLDPGHGGRAARANLSNPNLLAPYTAQLANGEITQAEYDAMFDLASSSFNNAIGAISNTLEKTMTHALIPAIRDRIEARAAEIVENDPNLEAIEVHLTKTDEFTNLSGRDRAHVARDLAADFFFCAHFNAHSPVTHVELDIHQVQGTVDGNLNFAITTLNDQNLGGTYPKSARSANGRRGPLTIQRPIADHTEAVRQNATSLGSSIATAVATALQTAENSAQNVTEQTALRMGLANISPVHLGNNDPATKQIVPVYLEGDYINIQSGDRLWNNADYEANIGDALTRWGIPPEPAADPERAAWRTQYLRREMPDLPAGHDMFAAAGEVIGDTLLANMNLRICQ
ncbi:N-acetylmuramoyl-L-alanine amidase [uncultured Litoreibacter sp.]|uniref:N-acetylmuramoyl-L-alanine amidase n=1 Tax=uncultured Litoreibacter sp. TaxID=1392394 RepID=UPI002625BACB|nr:N-acetylmuramoyl-L-alanine amidase [uncultured Litoreibacter sp.]